VARWTGTVVASDGDDLTPPYPREEDAGPIDPLAGRYCLIPDAGGVAAVRARLVGWFR